MQDMLDRQAFIDQNMQKKSPFDEGVMRAIKSAKQSIGMDEEQSDKAFRTGLMGFSEALNQDQTPTGRGFMGKFAAAARGVPAGMRAYDQSEATSRNENSLQADMAHRFRAAEEAKIAKMEQDAYMREMNDRKMAMEQEKLGEMRDYHNRSLDAKMASESNKELPHHKDIRQANIHNLKEEKQKLLSNMALVKTLDEVEEAFKSAKKNGYVGSSFKNALNRKWAHYLGDTEDLDIIEAAKKVYLARVKEGGGSNPSTVEFTEIMKTVPTSDKAYNASMKILYADRNKALDDIERYHKFANRLKETNYLADPIVETENYIANSKDGNEEYVIYVDPDTGEEEEIYFEDEPIAIKNGLVRKQ